MHPFFKIVAALFLVVSSLPVLGQTYQTDTIVYKGDSGKLINLVILGDGYQASEMVKFEADANLVTTAFLAQAPFSQYRNYFNVFAIQTPSTDSGTQHPNNAPDCGPANVPVSNPSTIFGSTFDAYGIHRLIVPMYNGVIMNVLANNFPNYDIVMVLVNTPYYGGSGGQVATLTLHTNADEVAIHELGHTFAGLADEYWAGPQYASERPNMTQQTNTNLVKWKNWLGFNNTGIYPYTGGTGGWHKPHQACKMEMLNASFCSVCRETIVEKIHALVNPVLGFVPTAATVPAGNVTLTFSLDLVKPLPNTLKTQWLLNNEVYRNNADQISIDPLLLSGGNHQLLVTVTDTTGLSRSVSHPTAHLYTVAWTISKTVSGLDITSNQTETEIGVFPNPTTDNVTINFTFDQPTEATFTLTDATGKHIYQSNPTAYKPGKSSSVIDQKVMATLPAGVYFINFSFNGNQAFSKKLIKQ